MCLQPGSWWRCCTDAAPITGKVLASDNKHQPMPNKHNEKRRHQLPKMTFKVTNWTEYDAGLKRRGSLILLVTKEAMGNWRGAPAHCGWPVVAIRLW